MGAVTEEQEADWCRRIRSGDRAAVEAFFRAAYPALVRYMRSLTAESKISAEDAAQEAFIRIWERRETLDPARSLRALLYTTARNRAFNQMRNTANRQDLREAMGEMPNQNQPAFGPDEAADAELLGRRLRDWIDELPERRREAFRLSRFDGLTYAEIAEVMNISARTVENHIRLALKHLRDRLHAFEPERLNP